MKLTGLGLPSQIGFLARFPCAVPLLGAGRRPLKRALFPPRQRGLARGVVVPGRPPSLSALRPAAPGDRENIMGRFGLRQIESVWSGPHSLFAQVRGVRTPRGESGRGVTELRPRRISGPIMGQVFGPHFVSGRPRRSGVGTAAAGAMAVLSHTGMLRLATRLTATSPATRGEQPGFRDKIASRPL